MMPLKLWSGSGGPVKSPPPPRNADYVGSLLSLNRPPSDIIIRPGLFRVASCCSGIQGSPKIVEQPPGKIVPQPQPPKVLTGPAVGVRVVSIPPVSLPIKPLDPAYHPTTPPMPSPPRSAMLHCDKVSTTSTACGKNPPAIPPVGVIPPKPSTVRDVCLPNSASVAPQPTGKIKGIALVLGLILVLWFLAGRLTGSVL